jgi:hypothetical protein
MRMGVPGSRCGCQRSHRSPGGMVMVAARVDGSVALLNDSPQVRVRSDVPNKKPTDKTALLSAGDSSYAVAAGTLIWPTRDQIMSIWFAGP